MEEDEDDQSTNNDDENDDGEQTIHLKAVEQKTQRKSRKRQEPQTSKTSIRQRLEQNLERFDKADKPKLWLYDQNSQ